jgi:hypothetical protein
MWFGIWSCLDVREQFDLSAQMTIRALGKIADAYSR